MHEVDNSYVIINKDGLKKTIMTINEYVQDNLKFEYSLMEKLDDIRSTILLDGKSIDNKNIETAQNMNTIKRNTSSSIKVFNSLIDKYSEALNIWLEK